METSYKYKLVDSVDEEGKSILVFINPNNPSDIEVVNPRDINNERTR